MKDTRKEITLDDLGGEFLKDTKDSKEASDRRCKERRDSAISQLVFRAIQEGNIDEVHLLSKMTGTDPFTLFGGQRTYGSPKMNVLHSLIENIDGTAVAEGIRRLVSEFGADIHSKNGNGDSAIFVALGKRNYHAFKTLMDLGADISGTNHSGENILESVANSKTFPAVFLSYLLRQEQFASRINALFPREDSRIPLIHLATWDKEKMNVVLDEGGDPNIKTEGGQYDGYNAAHWMFAHLLRNDKWKDRLRILKKNGCSVMDRTPDGKTIYDIARDNRNAAFTKEELLQIEIECLSETAKKQGISLSRKGQSSL